MRIRIEIAPENQEEIVIRAPALTREIAQIQERIAKAAGGAGEIAVVDGDREYYIKLGDLIFFDTYDGHVYAHTGKDCYQCRMKLYELEAILPRTFARASKGCLVNTACIRSMRRSLSGVTEVAFFSTEKTVTLSRMYYHSVRNIIEETRLRK